MTLPVLNLNFIYVLTIFFSCYANTVIPLVGKYCVSVSFLLVILVLFLLVIFRTNKFYRFLKTVFICKGNLYIPFIIFLVYAFFTNCAFIFMYKVSIWGFLVSFILGLVIQLFLTMIFGTYLVCKLMSIKNIAKVLYSTIFSIYVIGILDFVTSYLKIDFLVNIIQWIATERYIGMSFRVIKIYTGDIARVQSVFVEPSVFATFIAFFLPFVYSVSLSRYKIFDNGIINILLKRSMIFLAWANIIMTQSPIFLIISLIITFFYFLPNIIKIIRKHIKSVIFISVAFVIGLIVFLGSINIETTYLYRIIMFLQSVGDFNTFAYVEGSLATRVIAFINSLCLWQQSPIFGIGLGELGKQIISQMLNHSPVVLTEEIVRGILHGTYIIHGGFFYKYIAECGLIGISLLYYFFISIILKIRKIKNLLPDCLERDILAGISGFIWVFILLGFYNVSHLYTYIWLMLGIAIGIHCKYFILKDKNL